MHTMCNLLSESRYYGGEATFLSHTDSGRQGRDRTQAEAVPTAGAGQMAHAAGGVSAYRSLARRVRLVA